MSWFAAVSSPRVPRRFGWISEVSRGSPPSTSADPPVRGRGPWSRQTAAGTPPMASSARHARLASVAGPEQLTRSLAHSPGVAVAARAARTERVLVPRNASDSRSEGGSSPGPQPRPRPRPHAHAHPPLKFRRSVGLCVFSRSHENKVFAARRRDDTSGSWQLPQVRFSCGWGERVGRVGWRAGRAG